MVAVIRIRLDYSGAGPECVSCESLRIIHHGVGPVGLCLRLPFLVGTLAGCMFEAAPRQVLCFPCMELRNAHYFHCHRVRCRKFDDVRALSSR